jgi:hypothetical protein
MKINLEKIKREDLETLYKIRGKYNVILLCVIVSILSVLIGGIINEKVMEANDGKMPVKCCGIPDEEHFNYYKDSEVNYPILTDFISIGSKIYSVGDLMMYFGFLMVSISFSIINVISFKEIKLRKRLKYESIKNN